jgi:hypothetical protein
LVYQANNTIRHFTFGKRRNYLQSDYAMSWRKYFVSISLFYIILLMISSIVTADTS